MNKHYQKMAYITMLAAQAIVISVMERWIPSPFSFAQNSCTASFSFSIANFILVFKKSHLSVTFPLPSAYAE